MVVGLVGCGNWGRHILRDLVSLGCEVPVVARSRESVARAEEGGADAIVRAVDELPALDAAAVATPTTTHAAVLDEVLERGVPVFCEKPLTDDPEAAGRLAAQAPDTLFVMDKWRYHPGVQELAEIARDRRLGRVAGLRTVRVGWGNPHDDSDPVWVLAPHDLAIGYEILGVFGDPESAVAQWHEGAAVYLSGVLRADGWWQTLEVSSRSAERRRVVELYCEDGVAVLGDGWDEHVTVYRDGADSVEEERIETPGELPLLAELRAFVDHVRGGPPPRSSAAEGAAVVSMIAKLRALAA
jgi:predicted dehydrogenase